MNLPLYHVRTFGSGSFFNIMDVPFSTFLDKIKIAGLIVAFSYYMKCNQSIELFAYKQNVSLKE